MNKNNKIGSLKKKRVFNQLTIEERTKIEVRYRDGWNLREIAEYIGNGRTASSICREIAGRPRNGHGKYQAHIAHQQALDKRSDKKPFRLKDDLIQSYMIEKIKLGWSPEQISLRLPIDHKKKNISYEAIYQYVYARIHRGGNGVVKKDCEDLRPYLVRRHNRRQKKALEKPQKWKGLVAYPQ